MPGFQRQRQEEIGLARCGQKSWSSFRLAEFIDSQCRLRYLGIHIFDFTYFDCF